MTHDIVTELVNLQSRLVTDRLFIFEGEGRGETSFDGLSFLLPLGGGRKSPGNELGGRVEQGMEIVDRTSKEKPCIEEEKHS